VEQFERIRREHRDEGLSIRALADRHNVHRRTVRRAIADAVPPVRKPSQRQAPVLGPYESTIKRWLIEDLDAPKKQRHTARRIWQRLVEEEGAAQWGQMGLSFSTGPDSTLSRASRRALWTVPGTRNEKVVARGVMAHDVRCARNIPALWSSRCRPGQL
jgi:hypothetical protein